ncbi:Rap1 GTPase-GDP dissociation stimulator 1-B [Melipona quadrifasciata]|uniref:Rap1 GTPase-GDP dissociation stimulator 1-B n=1 Tax=Melipona quadrifasciata TaxID=166423 RepID=A0A0M9A2P7_9HYME|nr:Rap1 GTPase-GDP dissociation stimulator 1-B [Melipona quadrifasciata]
MLNNLHCKELKDSIDKLVEELRFLVKSEKKIEDINQVLDSIVNVSKTSIGGKDTEFTVDDVFLTLLRHESKEIIAKTAKAIAEIAKSERGREKCTSTDLVNALIDLLKEDRIDVLTQTSRALGNICYENENGKKFVEEKSGLISILAVLEKSITLKDVEGAPFLRNVAAGLLLNFLDRPSLHIEALKQVVPIICNILEIDGKNAKLLLAKAGVCELLLKLLEKHSPYCTDEETRSVLKIACNLIVLILIGDDSMNYLYDQSNGIAYKKLVEWLESEDKDLQITAVLAMGNFARTDTHCKLMVAQGVHRNLLKLLQKNNTDVADIRSQHALLSALRNLVIPADNKPVILKDGLIDVLYSMLNVSSYSVVFKLLGTLRIVIDGQSEAAVELGKRDGLMKKVVNWCEVEEHPGVQGEANRLIAWLINNSRNKEIAFLAMEHGAVKCLIKMLTVPHVLMLNEALISLMILTATSLVECESLLVKDDIGEKLCKLFSTSNNLEVPVLHNVLSLVDNILKSDALKEHLRKTDLITLCQETNLIKEEPKLHEKLEKICEKIV